jgi:hypothetical protein
MPAHHVDLVSHWHIAAPAGPVWAALADTGRWPQWWPQVSSARTLRDGRADGVGSVRRLQWRTGLPQCTVIDVETVEALPGERLRVQSHGRLPGESIWLLRSDGGSTDVTCLWRVELGRGWRRWLAALLAPLFRWHHAAVMRAGAAGLGRHLGAPPGTAARR